MSIAFLIAFTAITWWAIFHMQRFGSLDPHHVEVTSRKRWGTVVFSGFITSLILVIPGLRETRPDLQQFWAMLVLAQTVALAFTWPDRLRPDEEADWLRRGVEKLKSAAAGSLIAKLLSMFLAFALSRFIGDWWFVVLMGVGLHLMIGKAAMTLNMVRADGGEFASLSHRDRIEKMNELTPVVVKGVIGYVLGCGAFGLMIFQVAELEPGGWAGWAGLGLGALMSALITSIRA